MQLIAMIIINTSNSNNNNNNSDACTPDDAQDSSFGAVANGPIALRIVHRTIVAHRTGECTYPAHEMDHISSTVTR